MILAPGRNDVARVSPYQSGQPPPPPPTHTHTGQWLLACSHATGQRQSRNSGGRLEVWLLPGGRCPPGPDYVGRGGMADDVRRGQKRDGDANRPSCSFSPCNASRPDAKFLKRWHRSCILQPPITLKLHLCVAHGRSAADDHVTRDPNSPALTINRA